MLKIDNFKLGQIEKIVSFSKRGSLTEHNGTIINVQLLMVMKIFNFFKNFSKIADRGPRRNTEKFWQIEKKIGIIYSC